MFNLTAHTFHTNIGQLIRHETLEGRDYIVAPVVLITEGVHNNVFYSGDELAKHVDSWNGRPLVVPTHPTVNGRPVTANSKKVLEKMGVGMVLNVNWDVGTKKLKGEAWFDKEKLEKKNPTVLARLEQKSPKLEVSTGLFTDDVMRANSFNGKTYSTEAKNHRPDHLAILPDEKGACSWEDGAGLPRINSAEEGDELDEVVVVPETEDGEIPADAGTKCPECGAVMEDGECPECGYEKETPAPKEEIEEEDPKANSLFNKFTGWVTGLLRTNKSTELSFDEVQQKVSKALYEQFGGAPGSLGMASAPSPTPWICSIFPGHVIYNLSDKRYDLDYTIDGNEVVLGDEPVEVVQKTEWVPVKAEGDWPDVQEETWEVPKANSEPEWPDPE